MSALNFLISKISFINFKLCQILWPSDKAHIQNIILLIKAVYVEPQQTFLLAMEKMDGNVKQLLTDGAPMLSEPQAPTFILREAGNGIGYLHSLRIAHLDLKASNVVINRAREVKLIDFNLSQVDEGSGIW